MMQTILGLTRHEVLDMGVNPLVPTAMEMSMAALLALGAILAVWALIEVVRSPRLTSGAKLLWLLPILFVPVAGSVLWFAISRSAGRRSRLT